MQLKNKIDNINRRMLQVQNDIFECCDGDVLVELCEEHDRLAEKLEQLEKQYSKEEE